MSEKGTPRPLNKYHRVEGFNGSQVACECDRTWVSREEYAEHLAETVLDNLLAAGYTITPAAPEPSA